MRTQHRYLTFNRNDLLVSRLEKLAIKYAVKEKIFDDGNQFYALEFHLFEDDPAFKEKKAAVKEFKIKPHIYSDFEKKDYDTAGWFNMNVGEFQYPQPEDDFGYLKITFDLSNHCSSCGIGKVQNSPFRIKSNPAQKKEFWGLHWEFESIFVRQRGMDILMAENIKGISFSSPVIHRTGKPVDDLFQLHIHTTLPPGLDHYNAKTITCRYHNEEYTSRDEQHNDFCDQIKYNHPLIGGYTFNKEIFENMPDIVMTNEYFGSGYSAGRLPLISARLKKVIEQHKLSGIVYQPIFHTRQAAKKSK